MAAADSVRGDVSPLSILVAAVANLAFASKSFGESVFIRGPGGIAEVGKHQRRIRITALVPEAMGLEETAKGWSEFPKQIGAFVGGRTVKPEAVFFKINEARRVAVRTVNAKAKEFMSALAGEPLELHLPGENFAMGIRVEGGAVLIDFVAVARLAFTGVAYLGADAVADAIKRDVGDAGARGKLSAPLVEGGEGIEGEFDSAIAGAAETRGIRIHFVLTLDLRRDLRVESAETVVVDVIPGFGAESFREQSEVGFVLFQGFADARKMFAGGAAGGNEHGDDVPEGKVLVSREGIDGVVDFEFGAFVIDELGADLFFGGFVGAGVEGEPVVHAGDLLGAVDALAGAAVDVEAFDARALFVAASFLERDFANDVRLFAHGLGVFGAEGFFLGATVFAGRSMGDSFAIIMAFLSAAGGVLVFKFGARVERAPTVVLESGRVP